MKRGWGAKAFRDGSLLIIAAILLVVSSSCSKEESNVIEENPHKVTYYAYGESNKVRWIVPGEQFEVLSYDGRIPQGYSFEKWNTEIDGSGSNHPFNSMFTMGGANVNFYQVLEPQQDTPYTIEYYTQDIGRDSFSLAHTKSMKGTTDETVSAAIVEFEGFTLTEDHPDQISEGTILGDGSLTLKLYFERQSYPVTFNYDLDGYEDETADVQYGEYISKRKAPRHEGWVFLGWYTDKSFSNRWVLSEDTVTSSVTLYAKWIEATDVSQFEFDHIGRSTTVKKYTGKDLEVVIPEYSETFRSSPDKILDHAFFQCEHITSVIIPDSVTSIGEGAFSGCENLREIIIPDGVTYIGPDAFKGCRSLTSVTIPDSVVFLGSGAFSGCESLISVSLSKRMDNIGNNTFSGCSHLNDIMIPTNITAIGARAFSGCTGLENLSIPDSVIRFSHDVFEGCENFNAVYRGKNYDTPAKLNYELSDYLTTDASSFTYLIQDDQVTIDSFIGHETLVIIPESIEGYPVTSIAKEAFESTLPIQISIPDTVTSIGEYAFGQCSALRDIRLPVHLTAIQDGTFYDCDSLMSLTIPESVSSIGQSAFSGCNRLTKIIIPKSVSSIGGSAFSSCGIERIELPESLTSIGDYAFYGSKRLTTISIPEDVTSMGEEVFSRTRNLTDIYCEADKAPAGWDSGWNEDCGATVHWGASLSDRSYDKMDDSFSMVRPYNVGDIGPSGGFIFYVDEMDTYKGWDYLEAAPYGWYDHGDDPLFEWDGDKDSIYKTYTKIGSGKYNTHVVMPVDRYRPTAVQVCYDHSVTVDGEMVDDWFLPSRDELSQMYNNLYLFDIGDFSSSNYWSSSAFEGRQVVSNEIWAQWFIEKEKNVEPEESEMWYDSCVRPVRAF
ncbi:MAG: leucine-rich repeat protein [Sphaerochaetaceae bacterium]|nr:leucine-rich repeat protein [Sphaerochaetaceae bacterium]